MEILKSYQDFPVLFPIRGLLQMQQKNWFLSRSLPRLYQQSFYFLFQNPGQKTCMAAMITNLRNFFLPHTSRVCQAQKKRHNSTSNTKHYFFLYFLNILGLVPIHRRNISRAGSIRNLFFFNLLQYTNRLRSMEFGILKFTLLFFFSLSSCAF